MYTASSARPATDESSLVVWRPTDGRVRVANQRAADAVGLTLAELVGRSVFDVLALSPHVEVIATAVAVGAVDSCSHRRSHVVTRVLEVDRRREAATLWLPGGCGPELWPTVAAWPEAAPMALGYVDPAGLVTSVSADVQLLLDREPDECLGRPLGELVPLAEPVSAATPAAQIDVRLANSGVESSIAVLLARQPPDEPAGCAFALVGEPAEDPLGRRVTELEHRLAKIGTEVWAAGLGSASPHGTDEADSPLLGHLEGLTGRQREILEALLAGKRVPSIARELFLSQSTVRNHVAALFPRFGVHSQPELIERLRELARRD